ncbi:MAG: hypothetical protein WD771_08325 [Gemmatimonadaceae bacterium]
MGTRVRRCLALIVLVLAAPPLGAQAGNARVTYVVPNPLFQVVADQPLYCAAYPVDPQHRRQGIERMFQFQLPLTGRVGQLGVNARGGARYLSVYLDRAGGIHIERYTATVHFRPNGDVEVGRQSWEQLRTDSVGLRNVYGLHAAEAEQALELARHLVERCR